MVVSVVSWSIRVVSWSFHGRFGRFMKFTLDLHLNVATTLQLICYTNHGVLKPLGAWSIGCFSQEWHKSGCASARGCFNSALLQPGVAQIMVCSSQGVLQQWVTSTRSDTNHCLLQPGGASAIACFNKRLPSTIVCLMHVLQKKKENVLFKHVLHV